MGGQGPNWAVEPYDDDSNHSNKLKRILKYSSAEIDVEYLTNTWFVR
jgi:hypothetical protein